MKRYSKGFIGIGFIIGIIVAFGVIGGVSYYSTQQKVKEKQKEVSQSDSIFILQKINTTSQVIDDKGEKYCSKDSDCSCGVNIETKSCFVGNEKYVDATKQCPDFCSGIAGNLTTKCISNLCKQVSVSQ